MRFADVVETSRRVADTSKRLEKIELLGTLLRGLPPEQAEVVTAFLSGRALQGKIGVGYATLAGARGGAAETASIEVSPARRLPRVDRSLGVPRSAIQPRTE